MQKHYQSLLDHKKVLFTLLALLVVMLVLFLALGLPIIFLLITIYFGYRVATKILPASISPTKLTVAAISTFFSMAILQLSTYLVTLLPGRADIETACFISSSLLALLFWWTKHHPIIQRDLYGRVDLVAALSTVIFMSIMVILPIRSTGGLSPASVLELMNNGVDDATHLSMINERIATRKGIITDSRAEDPSRLRSATTYPSGWHAANSAAIVSIAPKISAGYDSMIAYVASKLFWLAYLVYIVTICSGILIQRGIKSKIPNIALAWLFLGSLLFAWWFIADYYIHGFYNFAPVLIAVPLLILLLLPMYSTKTTVSLIEKSLLPIIIISTVILSWTLVAPAFMICMASVILHHTLRKSFNRAVTLAETRSVVPPLIVITCTIIAVLLQLRLTSDLSATLSLKDSLIIPGGATIFPLGFFVAITGASLPFLHSIYTGKSLLDQAASQVVSLYIMASAVVVFVIYGIQQYAVQANEYYFYKSLSIVILGMILVALAGVGCIIARHKTRHLTVFSMTVSLIIMSAMVLYPSPKVIPYAFAHHLTSPAISKLIVGKLKSDHDNSHFVDSQLTFFISGPNTKLAAETGNMLLKSNKPHSACFDVMHAKTYALEATKATASSLYTPLCDNYKITIYTDSDIATMLNREAAEHKIFNYRFISPTDK